MTTEHRPEVEHGNLSEVGILGHGYTGVCPCGWVGTLRTAAGYAEDDCEEHLAGEDYCNSGHPPHRRNRACGPCTDQEEAS